MSQGNVSYSDVSRWTLLEGNGISEIYYSKFDKG